jgi:phosphatidate cytidylyltransferase
MQTSMLKTRVVTALALLVVFLSALLYLPPLGWTAFATLMAGLAAWEWGGLMGLGGSLRVYMGITLAVICGVVIILEPAALGINLGGSDAAWRLGRWFYLPAGVFWFFVTPLWMKYRWLLPKSILGMAIGLLLILPPWLALVQLRQAGALALLAIMGGVWLADIAAYFTGRTFGKHKLAPTISPGKTWEGAMGAVLAVLAYGFMLSPKLPPVFSENHSLLFVVLIFLTALSIIGDLFESLLKRQAGLKDSSNVLPGHGGVLDRIDSMTSTLPLLATLWLIVLH